MTDEDSLVTAAKESTRCPPAILITGGAGFIGATLAVAFRRRNPQQRVVALDNLRRRGSELSLPQLRECGVEFVHGDVRNPEDLAGIGEFDVLIDCSAEASVLAGSTGSPRQLFNINLLGTLNCLEAARTAGARVLFLSTSRVYPIARINDLPFVEEDDRYRWTLESAPQGVSREGIAETFSLEGPRSFYGTAKLASELMVQEYHHAYGMPALINRCGVIAGPGQMGRVDQGVVTLWAARHYFERPLSYIGFGGTGKQVRDVLHVADLFEIVARQLDRIDLWDGRVYNVGGGKANAISLRELTALCRRVTGKEVPLETAPQTHPFDVRITISDASRVCRDFQWRPQRNVEQIVRETCDWIAAHETTLKPILTT